jgi:Beta-propeller repeat
LLKLTPAGTALVYSTYLGGSGLDVAYGIAVGGSGNAYVTGTTGSTDFPVTPGAYQTTNSNTNDAFVAQVNATGSSLVYASYLGGDFGAHGLGIAVDGSGNAYVTGWTASTNFATAGAYQTVSAGGAAFVAELNAAGSARVYATYLGGSGNNRGLGIVVDGSGNTYVTGYTDSTNFPVFNAFQSVSGGSGDAFVTEFNASGSALLYSTYLGGNGSDNAGADGGAIALDAVGNIYVTGFTQSTNFPTLNAFQPSYGGGGGDAFVAKINPTLSGTASLVYSSYLGGSRDNEEGYGIAVDSSGNAYVAGQTSSNDFPTTRNSFQTRFGGTSDAFVTKITAN